MVSFISNLLTNPGLSTVAQSTTASVSLETGMKAVGRPSFILADKKLDRKTKNYAAVKEFLYQLTCLAVYMTVVIPIFKNGAFKLAKKCFKNDKQAFDMFKNAKEYLEYLKLAKTEKSERLAKMAKKGDKLKISDSLKNILKTEDKPETHSIIKGAIELGNIVGCVIGLAIVSPQVSHMVIRPAMKFLGLEKDKPKDTAPVQSTADNNLNIDA